MAAKALADIVVVDVVEGIPQGKALDILQSGPVANVDVRMTGANDHQERKTPTSFLTLTPGWYRPPRGRGIRDN